MILVTGGTGLVGSHLLYELVKKGEKVKALRRNMSDTSQVLKVFSYYSLDYKKLYSQINWVEGDVTDMESLGKTFENVDKVYHTAAIISMDSDDSADMKRVNVEGTANIVNMCLEKKISKLCYASSVAAIGKRTAPDPVDENTFYKGSKKNKDYASSKFNAEMEVWRGIAEGLNAVIVNPSIIIGPGTRETGSMGMFEKVGNGLKFYTRGITGYVDVHDVVRAMIMLMNSEKQGERYILNAENLSFKEIFNMIAAALDKKAPSIYANRLMTGIAWRMDYLRSKLSGTKQIVTREAADAAHRKTFYSNKKVKKATGIDFKPVSISIKETGEKYSLGRRNIKE